MTLYAFGLTAATNIAPELPHMTLGASSKPTTTQIGQWITAYSAAVLVQLEALGVCTAATASTVLSATANEAAYECIRKAITEAVVARVVMANQEQDTVMSQAHRAEWSDFLAALGTYAWKKVGAAAPTVTAGTMTTTPTPTWVVGTSFT